MNKHAVLTALLCNSEDFCANWSHFESLSTSDFARDGTRFHVSGTERHQRRRESWRIRAPIANEVEPYSQCGESGLWGATGILFKAIENIRQEEEKTRNGI